VNQLEERLDIVAALPEDLERFIGLLEEVAGWLEDRGIEQWRRGSFREAADFYAGSIARGEVQLAFSRGELVGAFRLLLREPVVWPEVVDDDAVYVFNLAVRREWRGHQVGTQMLDWVADRAAALGKRFVRLDCMADNQTLAHYYVSAGFDQRGIVEAAFPRPVGTLRLRRFEKPLT
jgi:ribosomal protein S18 acetylase RimI-like enzyme